MNTKLLNVKKWGFRILGLTALSFAIPLAGQMAGSYTIDASASASSTNFQDWQSFWQSLQGLSRNDAGPTQAGGVSSAVTVDVKSDLLESSRVTFPQISGMSSTNTVTINGNAKTLSYGGSYEVIAFEGGDYFTIKNLIIDHTSTSTSSRIIKFYNQSDYNTIDGCTLQFSGMTNSSSSTSSGSAYVFFSASSTSMGTYGSNHNGSYNKVINNLMRTTSSNSRGPTVGIFDVGGSSYSSTPSENTFENNEIQNFYYLGAYMTYTNGDQFLKNSFSRINATSYNSNSTLYGIYAVYNNGSNRSCAIDGNSFTGLPYTSATSGPSNFYGIYGWYNSGSSSLRFSVSNNSFTDVYSSGRIYLCQNYYNSYYDLIGNVADNCRVPVSSSSAYYFYGFYNYGSDNYRLNENTVKNCKGGYNFYGVTNERPNSGSTLGELVGNTISGNTGSYYYIYAIRSYYAYNSASYPIKITDNKVLNNSNNYYYNYCIYAYYYGNYEISRNTVIGNSNAGSVGYVYGIYNYYNYNSKINSNLIAGNQGYYSTYGIYSYYGSSNNYSFECHQNTVQVDGKNSSYSYHYGYGLMLLMYYHPVYEVSGNIVDIRNCYGGTVLYAYNYLNPSVIKWDYNSYYVQNCSYENYYTLQGSASTYSGWVNLGICGKNEYWGPPNFRSLGTDYSSDVFENQNNVPTQSSNMYDVNGVMRNAVKSDRGAVSSYLDIKGVGTNFTVPATVCAGYEVSGGTTITVENLYKWDTAKNFNVSYSVNGGPSVSEKVTAELLLNDQATVTFSKGLKLNELGNNRIVIFVDVPDDNPSNDSFVFTTFVKPAPGGAKWNFSATPTKTIYQYGKPNDVTILGEKAIYDMNPPRVFSNTDWGTKWTASAYATTASGASVSGAIISKNPSSTNDLEYSFQTSDANLEDSVITLYLKVSDLTNGCDTIVKRDLLIYPTIIPDFKYPAKICEGDAVAFENTSTVKSGNMEFEWDFGTGNPADITAAPEPVFQFPGQGNFTVTMKARTLPYKFEVSKQITITVNPIPTAKFSKLNACEGDNLVFTNQTVPSNSTYTWDFGDGGAKSTAVNPTKKYAQTGQYTVTLKADLNGCIAEVSQRVYQFDKPVADFALVSGSCDNDNFVFDNKSTIKNGLFGNSWDFNDGTVSTEEEPSHMFTSSGNKNVKLVTTSEFGCKNEKTVVVAVNESPKTDFTNDPACSLTPTTFTNTTPLAGSSVKSYAWNFGDGGTSAAQNPTHNWSTLGPKTVMFTVELVNGCKSSKTEMLNVGVQPNVQFNAADVCAGDPVVFENNTSWSQGEVKYNWEFGDNTTSTNSDPQKVYTTNVTKTYNVTLKAAVVGGCEAQLTKAVTVNQGPTTCDFNDAPDYGFGFRGMSFTPINGSGTPGAESGVSYTWVIDGGGTLQGGAPQYDFQEDGTYKVTMRARVTSTGCECTITKNVTMSRTSAEELTTSGFTVFPNPSNGNFNIALTKDFGTVVTVEITSLTGSVISSNVMSNTGLLSVASGNLSDGVYIVRVSNGNQAATRRITISR